MLHLQDRRFRCRNNRLCAMWRGDLVAPQGLAYSVHDCPKLSQRTCISKPALILSPDVCPLRFHKYLEILQLHKSLS